MRRRTAHLLTVLGLAFRANPRRMVFVTVLSIASMSVTQGFGYGLKVVVDGAVERDDRLVVLGGLITVGVFVALSVMIVNGGNVRRRLVDEVQQLIDERLMDIVSGVPGLAVHEHPEHADKLALLRAEKGTLANGVQPALDMVSLVFQVGTTVVLLASIHPVLLVLPLFAVPTVLVGRRTQAMVKDLQERTAEDGRRSAHLLEVGTQAAAGKELRIFGWGDELIRRQAALWDGIAREGAIVKLRIAGLTAAGWLAFGIGFCAAVAFVGARVARGQASPGDLLLSLTVISQLNYQVSGGVSMVGWWLACARAVDRYQWLMDFAATAEAQHAGSEAPPAVLRDGIVVEDVRFCYPGTDVPALDGVSLHLPAGRVVALVGENGAGKTSLVKLLCGFYRPEAGRVLVDGTDLADVDLGAWRAGVAAGFQDFGRFELLARETVGVGELDRVDDDVEVRLALERAGGVDVVDRLDGGLGALLGRSFEGGVELSGGQWQKLALGRAMMRPDPLLLVLDEPTSNLDPETEHALFERYAHAARREARARNGITLLVSHRFSTVRMADLIVVIDGGRVVATGSHGDLMADGGLYRELFELQARAYR